MELDFNTIVLASQKPDFAAALDIVPCLWHKFKLEGQQDLASI
ncbi:MAG: hypothetical protein PHP26_10810 [Syntrophomonas sp.]|nr:hypothetical protein [Syntrophomonas sp.]